MKFNKSRMAYNGDDDRFLPAQEERARVRLEVWARRWP